MAIRQKTVLIEEALRFLRFEPIPILFYLRDGEEVEEFSTNRGIMISNKTLPPTTSAGNRVANSHEIWLHSDGTFHNGKQRNTPIARFGAISMMPFEPVLNDYTGLAQESILIETHSITGHSGSPVFVQRPPMSPVPGLPGMRLYHREWFLGIDWGHLSHIEDVVDEGGKRHPDGWRVRSSSAIAAVVPTSKLLELLSTPKLVKLRAIEMRVLQKSYWHRANRARKNHRRYGVNDSSFPAQSLEKLDVASAPR